MRILVLFDGAGLARQGLEQAGHECVGVEIDPIKHYLGSFVGKGKTILGDVRDTSVAGFDAVWASPPCQNRSISRTEGAPNRVGLHSREYSAVLAEDLVEWSLSIDAPILWVENVVTLGEDQFGPVWNAAQFLEEPIQNRNRVVGGRYINPHVFAPYKRGFKGICPCITATEYRGCATDRRRASRFLGRKLTLEECAYYQGFTIPSEWEEPPTWYAGTRRQWDFHKYEAIGNGVPVYMAKAFGAAYA